MGDLTYYDPGLGACGKVSKDGDDVVSVSHFVFDAVGRGISDPNGNGLCGRKIRAVREGRSVDLVVVDRCMYSFPFACQIERNQFLCSFIEQWILRVYRMLQDIIYSMPMLTMIRHDTGVGCQPTSIDVPPATFAKLANPDLGRVDVTWAWLAPIPTISSS